MILWTLVITSITLTGLITLFPNHELAQFLLQPFDHIPYGNYVAKKWFLVVVAFLTLIYWLWKKEDLFNEIKLHLLPAVLIALSLLVARFQSFQGWFWHDDYREIGYFMQNTGYVDLYYPFAVFFLVVRWFGINFPLYNAFGLACYLVSGIFIYLISNQLQTKKYISLLAAIFFVTTPAYFQEWFLMINFTGNAFVLMLFIISLYFLLKGFFPGALIFTAAAVEFGIVRTHFTPFYIILAGLLFISKKVLLKKPSVITLIFLLLIPLFYLRISLSHLSFSAGNTGLTINHFLTIGDMLAEIAIPFVIFTPLMQFLGPFFNNWPYLPSVIGYLVLLIPLVLILVFRKKVGTSKIFILGLIIFVTGVIVPSLIGRRVHHDAEKFLIYHQSALYPTVTTAYSIFSVVGLTLFLIGLGGITKPQIYKAGMVILIILNISTYIKSDQLWIQSYAYPQRKQNDQLETLLNKSQPLYIYVVPSTDPSLKHYQRHLWQGIRNFQMTHRPNQLINAYLYQKDLEEAVNKDKPLPTQIYFLREDASYNIKRIDSIPLP